jgi:hypothetical protein
MVGVPVGSRHRRPRRRPRARHQSQGRLPPPRLRRQVRPPDGLPHPLDALRADADAQPGDRRRRPGPEQALRLLLRRRSAPPRGPRRPGRHHPRGLAPPGPPRHQQRRAPQPDRGASNSASASSNSSTPSSSATADAADVPSLDRPGPAARRTRSPGSRPRRCSCPARPAYGPVYVRGPDTSRARSNSCPASRSARASSGSTAADGDAPRAPRRRTSGTTPSERTLGAAALRLPSPTPSRRRSSTANGRWGPSPWSTDGAGIAATRPRTRVWLT